MAQNLDRVLAGERDIKLRDMNEGELAILSSEIDKVIARLHLTVDELQAEKLALSDALADISHQLKTPLTSIAISTELIRDRLAERGDARDIVERLRLVQRLQGRVEDLVSALLKLARIDAGVIKLVTARSTPPSLCARALSPSPSPSISLVWISPHPFRRDPDTRAICPGASRRSATYSRTAWSTRRQGDA